MTNTAAVRVESLESSNVKDVSGVVVAGVREIPGEVLSVLSTSWGLPQHIHHNLEFLCSDGLNKL